MSSKIWTTTIVAVIIATAGLLAPISDVAHAQAPPPLPYIYSGTVTVDGSPVPDGLLIFGRVGSYESEPVAVKDGSYVALTVGPPATTFSGQPITFHLNGVQANETDTYVASGLPTVKFNFNLTFPNLPEPTPTPSPIPTPTPVIAKPAVYSGPLVVAGAAVPDGAVLVARIGSYESLPAFIEGREFRNLVVNPGDINLAGQTIEFFLNGVKSAITGIYQSGSFVTGFTLVFEGVPTPTPTPIPATSHTAANGDAYSNARAPDANPGTSNGYADGQCHRHGHIGTADGRSTDSHSYRRGSSSSTSHTHASAFRRQLLRQPRPRVGDGRTRQPDVLAGSPGPGRGAHKP